MKRFKCLKNPEAVVVDSIGSKHSLTGKVGGGLAWWKNDHWPIRSYLKKTSKCKMCSATFTLFRHRRQCRVCHHVFCSPCSRHKVYFASDGTASLSDPKGKNDALRRVCDTCYLTIVEKKTMERKDNKQKELNQMLSKAKVGDTPLDPMEVLRQTEGFDKYFRMRAFGVSRKIQAVLKYHV